MRILLVILAHAELVFLPPNKVNFSFFQLTKWGRTRLGRTNAVQNQEELTIENYARGRNRKESPLSEKKTFLIHIPLSSYRVAFIDQLIASRRKASKRTVLLVDYRRPTLPTPRATSPTKNQVKPISLISHKNNINTQSR